MDDEMDDPSCYMVAQTHDYEYDEEFDWTNMSAADCNCSHPLHKMVQVCYESCQENSGFLILPPFNIDDFFDIALPAIIYLLVFLIGTTGNVMVIFVVNRFKRMKTVTNVFLASLSTADLCLLLFCVPIMFIKFMSHSWFMGRFACYGVHYIQQFCCFCSVLTMSTISFERYMAIAYPMRNMWLSSIGRAKKVLLCIWLLSAVLAVPTAVRIDYELNLSLLGERVHWCRRRFPANFLGYSRTTLNRIYAVYQLLLLIVFPVVTMTICYSRVAVIVYTSSKDRMMLSQAMVAFSKAATDAVTFSGYSTIPMITTAKPLKIVQMLISIVIMYIVCWMPTIVDELLTSYGYICRTSNTSTLKHMRMGFNALTYCQSCINPILYAFISQNFRATFKSAYSRMKHRLQGVEEMRSRMGSCSSASMLSTRNHHRIYGSSFNTLTVPGRSIITPNMSRDISQLSLCRPISPGAFGRPRSPIAHDGNTMIGRPRSPTDISHFSRDSGRPRSPTDVSQASKPRGSISIRPRSPTTSSQNSMMPMNRSRSPTGYSEISIAVPMRNRSPTGNSTQSGHSNKSLPPPEREHLLTVMKGFIRSKTPPH